MHCILPGWYVSLILAGATGPHFCSVNPSGGTPIMACSFAPSTFICDLNGTACAAGSGTFRMSDNDDFTLREDQVSTAAAALGSTLAASGTGAATGTAATVTETLSSAASEANGGFSSGDMAGVGAGVGVPLLLALIGVSFLLWKEKAKNKRIEGGGYQHAMAHYGGPKEAGSGSSVPPSQSLSTTPLVQPQQSYQSPPVAQPMQPQAGQPPFQQSHSHELDISQPNRLHELSTDPGWKG